MKSRIWPIWGRCHSEERHDALQTFRIIRKVDTNVFCEDIVDVRVVGVDNHHDRIEIAVLVGSKQKSILERRGQIEP